MNYILILLLLYILWRLVTGFSGRGALRNKGEARDLSASEELAQDPVCGVYVPKSTAFKLKRGKEHFYFCGKDCRKKFLEK